MLRIAVSAALISFVAGAALAHERSPFRAGVQPDAKKSPQPENRGKIIDEIRTDLDSAVDKLNRQDPGRQTRVIQDRILDNLKKLLDPDDDTPPPSSNSSNPPPKPMPPPSAQKPNSEPRPKPSAQPESNPKPSGQPESKPLGGKPNASAKENSPSQLPPQVKDEPKHDMRQGLPSGAWPNLPYRHRQQVDAASGDRFVPRYEDLLREYYRALANGGRRE